MTEAQTPTPIGQRPPGQRLLPSPFGYAGPPVYEAPPGFLNCPWCGRIFDPQPADPRTGRTREGRPSRYCSPAHQKKDRRHSCGANCPTDTPLGPSGAAIGQLSAPKVPHWHPPSEHRKYPGHDEIIHVPEIVDLIHTEKAKPHPELGWVAVSPEAESALRFDAPDVYRQIEKLPDAARRAIEIDPTLRLSLAERGAVVIRLADLNQMIRLNRQALDYIATQATREDSRP